MQCVSWVWGVLFNFRIFNFRCRVQFGFHTFYVSGLIFGFCRGVLSRFLFFFFFSGSWGWSVSVLIVSVSFFWLEVEGMFFDLSVGVSCTLGIIVLRVLISSCRSFIKFVNSSIFIVFICVFALFSTWFEGVLVTWEKVNLLKGFSMSLLASGKVMFLWFSFW